MCWLFPCIPVLRGYFFKKKSVKKMCVCVGVKNCISNMKNVFFGVKEGISELGGWVAQRHTTYED